MWIAVNQNMWHILVQLKGYSNGIFVMHHEWPPLGFCFVSRSLKFHHHVRRTKCLVPTPMRIFEAKVGTVKRGWMIWWGGQRISEDFLGIQENMKWIKLERSKRQRTIYPVKKRRSQILATLPGCWGGIWVVVWGMTWVVFWVMIWVVFWGMIWVVFWVMTGDSVETISSSVEAGVVRLTAAFV